MTAKSTIVTLFNMCRLSKIIIGICLTSLLTGCAAEKKQKPIWENIKLGDIALIDESRPRKSQAIKTIDLNIYIFDMPAQNITALNDVWNMLHKEPLRFRDYQSFSANLFAAGFGHLEMWDQIGNLLRDAGGRKRGTISLLVPDGQANDLEIAQLKNKKTFFYTRDKHTTDAVTIGPGQVVLRLKAEKIPGARGVCRIEAEPVFTPPFVTAIPQLADLEKEKVFHFTSLGLELKMSPGEFLLLG
ncbi:MAG: hypothetical protein ACYSRZ_04915, partial [Planctomycetota bacterium]